MLLQSVRSELQAILHGISAEITVGADGLAGVVESNVQSLATIYCISGLQLAVNQYLIHLAARVYRVAPDEQVREGRAPMLARNLPLPWVVESSSPGKRHPGPTMVSHMVLISRARRRQSGR